MDPNQSGVGKARSPCSCGGGTIAQVDHWASDTPEDPASETLEPALETVEEITLCRVNSSRLREMSTAITDLHLVGVKP
jgi:hypothetical protein